MNFTDLVTNEKLLAYLMKIRLSDYRNYQRDIYYIREENCSYVRPLDLMYRIRGVPGINKHAWLVDPATIKDIEGYKLLI